MAAISTEGWCVCNPREGCERCELPHHLWILLSVLDGHSCLMTWVGLFCSYAQHSEATRLILRMNLCQVRQEFGWFCHSGCGPWIGAFFFNVFSIVVSGWHLHPQLKKNLAQFYKTIYKLLKACKMINYVISIISCRSLTMEFDNLLCSGAKVDLTICYIHCCYRFCCACDVHLKCYALAWFVCNVDFPEPGKEGGSYIIFGRYI